MNFMYVYYETKFIEKRNFRHKNQSDIKYRNCEIQLSIAKQLW